MKKGKLIVFDGIDGSGKATQARLLAKRLKVQGSVVNVIDFPRYYSNFMGKFIGRCLAGKHGNFLHLDPYIASVLFAVDRFESSNQISAWLEQGYIVIADRYASANQIHQAGKILEAAKRKKMIEWLDKLEFGVFKIPKPNAIIYLDVPVAVTKQLGGSKVSFEKKYLKGAKDQHESDEEFLENSRQSALNIVKGKNNWIMINCVRNGEMMTKKEISDMIWNKVKRIFNK